MDFLSFVILGLGSGAIYAAFATGIVLVHRASGVIHFGFGATALFGVLQYADLRRHGILVLPVGHIDLGTEPSVALCMLLVLAHALLFTLLIYLLCFAPLHAAPPLARVVASVGVMLAVQALILQRFGSAPRSVAAILPNEPVTVLGATLPRDRLYLAAIALLFAAALHLWSTRTRFGKATRGAAENEKAAILLGLRPRWLAAVSWLLAGAVVTVVGILIAPTTSLEAGSFTLLIVPALGAALVGRLSSVAVAAVAGLALGGLQSGLLYLTREFSWLPQNGLKQGLPFLLVVLMLMVAGRRLPGRGTAQDRLPPAPAGRLRPVPIAAAVVAAAILLPLLSSQWRLGMITSGVAAVLCLSLVVLTGFVGQISLAQMSLAGVAGFTLSKVTADGGVPFPVGPLIAVLAATALGLLVAVPALRVRGLHLAVVTLAAAVAIEEFIFKNPKVTGGLSGSTVPQPEIFGFSLGIRGGAEDFPRVTFGYFVLVVTVAAALGVAALRRHELGRRMLAVRGSERAAAAAGINAARVKLTGAAISSALAGVGGTLLAYQQGQLSYASYSTFTSLGLLVAVYLGGITSVSGALVGGTLYSGGLVSVALHEWAGLGDYETLILSIGLIIVAIRSPDGLAGLTRQRLTPRLRQLARRTTTATEPTVTTEPIAGAEPIVTTEPIAGAEPTTTTKEVNPHVAAG
ncbi:branched-chain amino acid transport system permease protein [Parafrankia irregularis]|uniref:Branched-chain amino acid transport system permease protein n=1 Tax=Parafrankia irregularis TaxID=795642 RepID=A0A0S4QNZ2_9ACTN|nr:MULTISPECIES: ABC transporter permease [Parafrankia]MBE3200047.1 ABC transporter permease [Parafrankia sp. CH37]CUU56766.1 branched-chain amino acid transport system permease protein [Parafrankia irregularis]